MLVHWIWFAHRPGLNDRDKMALLQHFRDPEDIYFADDGAFDAIGLSEDAKTALREKNLTSAEEILEACDREKLHILTCQDAAYPARLKNIADPPNVLYYKGRLPDFDGSPVIGVVGTRKASAYGLTTAKRMGYQIARCGGIVVSGMAYGIDGMAMSGALTAGAPAVGVLGCGADIVYPVSNRALFRDTEEYGCILSEFAPGTPPAKWTFPKRNRIISGLSCGVLVVEAPEKSGALITATTALEQGREVFAVPGPFDAPMSRGTNALIREGAGLVCEAWDVLSFYESRYPHKLRPLRAKLPPLPKGSTPPEDEAAPAQPAAPAAPSAPALPVLDISHDPAGLTDDQIAVLSVLQTDVPTLTDDAALLTDLPVRRVLSALTVLEIDGYVSRQGTRSFLRTVELKKE